jgi:hypothetical protein
MFVKSEKLPKNKDLQYSLQVLINRIISTGY